MKKQKKVSKKITKSIREFEKEGNFSEAAKLYYKIGETRKAAELYVADTIGNVNRWSLIDAAKLYIELGDKKKAAELYEKHGSYDDKAAILYKKIGEKDNAERLFNKIIDRSDFDRAITIAKKERLESKLTEICEKELENCAKKKDFEKIAKIIEKVNFPKIAGEYLLKAVEEETQSIKSLLIEEAGLKKVKEIATSRTKYSTTEKYSKYTDNFGERDSFTIKHLKLEFPEIDPKKIWAAGAYLLANNYEELSRNEMNQIIKNLKNITAYLK